MNMIDVAFGSESVSFPAGYRVVDIRDTLKHVLNIPPDAQPRVNGELVDWEERVDSGTLEFVKAKGSKGGGWAVDGELPERFRPHLDEFRRTHPSPKDWYEPEPGVYLYREAALYAEFGPPSADEIGREILRFTALGGQADDRPASAAPPDPLGQRRTPHYDNELRRITVGGVLIKKYHEPSRNQIAVLIAFEEAGWPAVIDDPIPGSRVEPKRRLRDTVAGLNASHRAKNIVLFHAENDGEGISWELVDQQQR